jgi:hypothetical protein
VLRFFNDVCGAEVELDELSKISAKYSDDIKYEMNLPEPVYYADTTENDEEDKYNQVTKLSPITINYIVLDASKKIKVNHEERWNNGHNPEENKLSLEVDEITTAMFLMQIPDEIHAALTEIEANLTKDEAEADKLIQQVKDRLATYAVMDALN